MIKLRTNAYKILVGKRVRKKLLVRPKRRWKDNIETILKDTVCVCVCVCVCVWTALDWFRFEPISGL